MVKFRFLNDDSHECPKIPILGHEVVVVVVVVVVVGCGCGCGCGRPCFLIINHISFLVGKMFGGFN